MHIEIISSKITKSKLISIADKNYGEMTKGVVDLDKKIIALGGELHADAEAVLLKNGSDQKYLWGFNIYPNKPKEDRIEYTSFINIRPKDGNRSIEIQDNTLKQQIKQLINQLIE